MDKIRFYFYKTAGSWSIRYCVLSSGSLILKDSGDKDHSKKQNNLRYFVQKIAERNLDTQQIET